MKKNIESLKKLISLVNGLPGQTELDKWYKFVYCSLIKFGCLSMGGPTSNVLKEAKVIEGYMQDGGFWVAPLKDLYRIDRCFDRYLKLLVKCPELGHLLINDTTIKLPSLGLEIQLDVKSSGLSSHKIIVVKGDVA